MSQAVRPLVPTPAPTEELPVGGLSEVLSARKLLVVAITAVVTVVAVASALRHPSPYVSDASVLISTGASSPVQVQQNMSTEQALAQSRAVAATVIHDLHLDDSPEKLLVGLSTDVPLNTQVLDITYSDVNPERAKRLSQGFADAYVKYRQTLVDQVVASYGTLDARIRGSPDRGR